jgi:hypothetical protein
MYQDGDRFVLVYPHIMKAASHYEVVAVGPFSFYILDKKTKAGKTTEEYGYEIMGHDPETNAPKSIKIYYGQKNKDKAIAHYKRIRGERSTRAAPTAVGPFSVDKMVSGKRETWAVWGFDFTGEAVDTGRSEAARCGKTEAQAEADTGRRRSGHSDAQVGHRIDRSGGNQDVGRHLLARVGEHAVVVEVDPGIQIRGCTTEVGGDDRGG